MKDDDGIQKRFMHFIPYIYPDIWQCDIRPYIIDATRLPWNRRHLQL